jgi:hypothetical protein
VIIEVAATPAPATGATEHHSPQGLAQVQSQPRYTCGLDQEMLASTLRQQQRSVVGLQGDVPMVVLPGAVVTQLITQ